MNKALVVLSGGMDSATCLGYALAKYGSENTLAVSFNYGQRHGVELEAAWQLATKHRIHYQEVAMPALNQMTSALTTDLAGDPSQPHQLNDSLPASFVPARNAVFLSVAFGIAMSRGCGVIYTGVCETDYSGYPDCRADFIRAFNDALRLGYQKNITIATPLMHLDKAQTFALAEATGVLEDVLFVSRTCYVGSNKRNEWGHGCGECPACTLREAGWRRFVAGDFKTDGHLSELLSYIK